MSAATTERSDTAAEAITPTARTVGRRAVGGIVVGVAALVAAALTVAIVGLPSQPRDLDVDGATPTGGRAVAEVLRQQGVDVRAADSLSAVRDAAADREDTTVLVIDDDGILDRDTARSLRDVASHVILVQPDLTVLHALAPGVDLRGSGRGVIAAGCRIGGLTATDRVLAGGLRYLPVDAAGAEPCLGDDDAGYGLVRLQGGTRVDVLGARDALHNAHAGQHANAAFALGLLGETPRLVWYRPSAADLSDSGAVASLYPGWYTPIAVLLGLVGIAAILWRTRRFGPLAVENLPVVVPASETMEGRARLYARSSARLRALDALRVGTIGRLARALGLPRSADLTEVVTRVAAVTGEQPVRIGELLVDAEPASDAELTRLSDELLLLEQRVVAAVRPAGAPRGGS